MNARSASFDSTRVEGVSDDAAKRLNRLRRLTWVLDRSIPVGNARIGLDPIIGLVPGVGDWIASLMSVYLLYEGARLGLPYAVLARMTGNIGVEAVVGAVPVLGDLFDFVWQSNSRNLELIDRHYSPSLKPRKPGKLIAFVVVLALLLTFVTLTLAFLMARWLWQLFAGN